MLSLVGHWLDTLRIAAARRQAVAALAQLSDAQLRDIDLERGLIDEQVEAGLPLATWSPAERNTLAPALQGCG